MNMKEKNLSVFIIALLFIGGVIFTKQYGYLLESIPYLNSYYAAILYVMISVVAVVIAPVSTFPLLPLAVSLWGSFLAAVLSIIAWTLGASLAFGLARLYGKALILKIVSLEKIQHIEKLIPQKNIFISVVLLRMILPVDVLSYALGIFSSISFKHYFFATLVGVAPFAFFFTYALDFPLAVQFLVVALVLIILASGYRKWHRYQKK